MSDTKLRDLERRWKETGTVDDEAAYLLERVRAGDADLKSLDLHLFGRRWTLPLTIETEWDLPPNMVTEEQRAALLGLLAARPRFEQDAERALYAHYQEVAPDHRTDLGASAERLAPPVAEVAGLVRVLTPTQLVIAMSHALGKPRRVLLLLDCTWDASHGVGVEFVDGRVAQTGEQQLML